jgi:hypothetical protein
MRELAAGWMDAAVRRCVPGHGGDSAGAAAGGGEQGGDGFGKGEGLRGREGGVDDSVITCISHGDWHITGTRLPRLLGRFSVFLFILKSAKFPQSSRRTLPNGSTSILNICLVD